MIAPSISVRIRAGFVAIVMLASTAVHADMESVFDGPYSSLPRVQFGYHNNGDFRASTSFYGANSNGIFVLGAADYNFNVRRGALDTARLQFFSGAPLFHGYWAKIFGWVVKGDLVDIGRMNRATGKIAGNLADIRAGIQITAQGMPFLSPWLTYHGAELFFEAFPVRTNNDFGTVDFFIRYSKRFTSRFVLRGVLRVYCFTEDIVITTENDLIYEFNKRFDVFARFGKSNRDWPGLAQRQALFGAGMRLSF